MRRGAGFTLLELLVVVGIIGIMSATAMPLYRTFQQRTYGREALVMVKQILDAQIAYFLENDKFFPETGDTIEVYQDDPQTKAEIQQVMNALNLHIPVNHFLDYYIAADNTPGSERAVVTISASFPLFKDGSNSVWRSVDRNGDFLPQGEAFAER